MRAAARVLLRCAAGLLALALFVQFFIAGMAALTNAEWWSYHLTWVALFQWLVVALPVLAWLAGPPLPIRATLACVPFVHMGCNTRWPIGRLTGGCPSASVYTPSMRR